MEKWKMKVRRKSADYNKSHFVRYRNSPFSIINFQLSKAKMLEYNNNCEQNSNPQQRANIYAGDLELAHAGAANIAAVQSALHGGSELIRPAEGGDKQGHQQRDQGLGPLDQVAGVEIRAACLLCREIFSVSSMRVGMKRSAIDIIMDSSCTGACSFLSGESRRSSPSVS